MRMRRKPNIQEKLDHMSSIVFRYPWMGISRKDIFDNNQNPDVFWGPDWAQVFGNEASLHLELGTGKGIFITTLARHNPSLNYIGVERVPEIIYKAARKQRGIHNLRFLMADVEHLSSFFRTGQIERIYLNFSDPWPKTKHSRRRLTYSTFLDIYKKLLKSGGEIHFKTDNRDFFDFSLQSFAENGFSLKNITYDLHYIKDDNRELFQLLLVDNIMTEYEKKFTDQGYPICRCIAINP